MAYQPEDPGSENTSETPAGRAAVDPAQQAQAWDIVAWAMLAAAALVIGLGAYFGDAMELDILAVACFFVALVDVGLFFMFRKKAQKLRDAIRRERL